MKEELVKHDTFHKAKEIGFEWYTTNKGVIVFPTQTLLQKWLRKEHSLHILTIPTVTCYYAFKIIDVQCDPENEIERPPYSNVDGTDWPTHEEALEKGLIAALNLIESK